LLNLIYSIPLPFLRLFHNIHLQKNLQWFTVVELDTLWLVVPILFLTALSLSSFLLRWRFPHCFVFFLLNTVISLLLVCPILTIPFTGEFLLRYTVIPRQATWSYLFLDSTAWSNFLARVSRHSYASSVSSILFTFPLLIWLLETIVGTKVTSRLFSIPFRKGLVFYLSVYLWVALGLTLLRVWWITT